MNMENEPNQAPDSKPAANKMGAFTAIGAGVGAAIGVATDNLAAGVAIGVAIGAAIGAALDRKGRS